jgi:hypothetical protein
MALVRTDYGLIYNTDGSLCATLLPEGGVAVDKPTTNYTDAKTPPTLLVPADWGIEQVGPYKWKIYAKKDNPGVGDQYNRVAFFAGQYGAMANEPVTHSAYVFKNTDNLYIDAVGFGSIENKKDGNRIWRTIAHTDAWTHRQAVGCTNPSQIKLGDYIIVDMPQLEASSHLTAFVDGSRPVGRLSYSGDKINIDHTTWHFDWKPFQDTNSMTAQATYPVIFAVGAYSRNSMVLWFYNQQINLFIRGTTTEETWSGRPIWVPPSGWYQPGKKYKVTVQIIDKGTFKVFIDGQKIIETTISDPFSVSVANQKISVGNFYTAEGIANAVYYNLRMVHDRYVSEEEILTWHSLNAPFYDPREQIDAAAKTIHMYQSNINGHGHTVRDQYGKKAVFSGVDPDTGDRGYKVYDNNGSDEAAFLGVKADGRRGLMLKEGDTTWLDPGGIAGSKVMSLPWTSLDSVTHLLFAGLFEGNFIIADESGEYGFNFGEGASQIKSYVLKATEDAYVNSLGYAAFGQVYSWRDVNYGSETRLRIANNAEYDYSVGQTNYDKYAYIKFSGLSSIPSTEEIVDAEMRLYFTNLSATRFMLVVSAATWSETTITWNNQPGSILYGVTFDAKLGATIIKKAPLIETLDLIRANGWESRGFRIEALDESREESVLYSREGHSSLCPTLVVYTRESQTPVPGLNLHVPGGKVFLNRKIFDVSGDTLTLDASRNDITIYVYENEDGEAVIDFAHGGRAFKADSYVILGTVTTDATKITGRSAFRKDGRKEGPKGYGNDVYSFGYPGDGNEAIDISTLERNPQKQHLLGGHKHRIMLEILPAGQTEWQPFQPMTYTDGSNQRGITVRITSDSLLFDAGTTSIYRYTKADGSPVDVTAAQIRGIITRLD